MCYCCQDFPGGKIDEKLNQTSDRDNRRRDDSDHDCSCLVLLLRNQTFDIPSSFVFSYNLTDICRLSENANMDSRCNQQTWTRLHGTVRCR